jgi:hypothetical protein
MRPSRGRSVSWALLCLAFWMVLPSSALAAAEQEEWETSVFESNKISLVFITTKATRHNGLVEFKTGTGFIVHPDGYVLTCKHLVPEKGTNYKAVEITGSVGGRFVGSVPLQVIRRDDQADLALLKLPEQAGRWRTVERTAQGKIGTRIVALGFPQELNFLPKEGLISSTDGRDGLWVTDAALNPGMSGGPVFDRNGAVVALVVGGYEEENGLNLLIPINFALNLLEKYAPDSPLLRGSPATLDRQARKIRTQIRDSAQYVSDIQQILNGGGPLFAASASLETELYKLLRDVPKGQRLAALGNTEEVTRAVTAAWHAPKAAELSKLISDSAGKLVALTGDWEILSIPLRLLSKIGADAYSPPMFSLILSPELLRRLPIDDPESMDAKKLAQELARQTQSNAALYYVVRYQEATRQIGDFTTLFASVAARLPDSSLVAHAGAPEAENPTYEGTLLDILGRFRTEIDRKSYEDLVALAQGLETSLSKEKAATRIDEFGKKQKDRQNETHEEIVRALFQCLKRVGVQDPNVDLFLGVMTGDSALVEKALEAGASTQITDAKLLESYESRIALDCPDLYAKYQSSLQKAPEVTPH